MDDCNYCSFLLPPSVFSLYLLCYILSRPTYPYLLTEFSSFQQTNKCIIKDREEQQEGKRNPRKCLEVDIGGRINKNMDAQTS